MPETSPTSAYQLRLCKVAGCTKPYAIRGLCYTHYTGRLPEVPAPHAHYGVACSVPTCGANDASSSEWLAQEHTRAELARRLAWIERSRRKAERQAERAQQQAIRKAEWVERQTKVEAEWAAKRASAPAVRPTKVVIPPAPHYCAHPGCDAELVKKPGPGKWPKWCAEHRKEQKLRRHALALASRRPEWVPKACKRCQEPIPDRGNNHHAVYCSDECRSAVEHDARTERFAAQYVPHPRAPGAPVNRTFTAKRCEQCDSEFESTGPARFCTERCRTRYRRAHPLALCSSEGCARAVSAKGLCKPCYNAARRASGKDAPAPWSSATQLTPCFECGKLVRKQADPRRKPFCSWKCRADYQFGADRRGNAGTDLVPVTAAYEVLSCKVPESHPARTPSRKQWRFVMGRCSWCRTVFTRRTVSGTARYCSDDCSVEYSRSKSQFKVPPQVRYAIYKRDNWTCQLCGEHVDRKLPQEDRLSATLDHIECQSWALISDDSPKNLRLAHRGCNSKRNAEQYVTAAEVWSVIERPAQRRVRPKSRATRGKEAGFDGSLVLWEEI